MPRGQAGKEASGQKTRGGPDKETKHDREKYRMSEALRRALDEIQRATSIAHHSSSTGNGKKSLYTILCGGSDNNAGLSWNSRYVTMANE